MTENLDDINILGTSLWPPVMCVLPSTSANGTNQIEHVDEIEDFVGDSLQQLLPEHEHEETSNLGITFNFDGV